MTKKLTIILILINIIGIAIIPLNLYLIHMPECISVIIALCIILLNIYLWLKANGKKVSKVLLSVFSILVILVSLFGTYCNPYWNSLSLRKHADTYVKDDTMILTSAEALKDLNYAMKYLQKLHPALYRRIPADVEKQYELVKKNIEDCESIDICTLSQQIESVFSTLGDAHTFAYARYHNFHFLKYIYEHNEAGDKVTQINGVALEDLFQKNTGLISYESEAYGMTKIYEYISSLEGLRYLGISVRDGVEYTYRDVAGKETDYIFTTEDFVTYEEYAAFNKIEENDGSNESFVHYEIDTDNDVAILTLDSCINNQEYQECLDSMFREIKEKGIHNVVVDLRNNGGGDSSVADAFFKYLNIEEYKIWADVWRLGMFEIKNEAEILENPKEEGLVFEGDLYLLTSVYTFSSAMDFSELVKDNHLGTIIGEAPGNDPSSYGDISYFTLPNSGIYMQISTKKWYRIDESLEHQLIEPDILCEPEDAMDMLYETIEQRGSGF